MGGDRIGPVPAFVLESRGARGRRRREADARGMESGPATFAAN